MNFTTDHKLVQINLKNILLLNKKGSSHLVVFGADFRVGGYHRANARRGQEVRHC